MPKKQATKEISIRASHLLCGSTTKSKRTTSTVFWSILGSVLAGSWKSRAEAKCLGLSLSTDSTCTLTNSEVEATLCSTRTRRFAMQNRAQAGLGIVKSHGGAILRIGIRLNLSRCRELLERCRLLRSAEVGAIGIGRDTSWGTFVTDGVLVCEGIVARNVRQRCNTSAVVTRRGE